LADREYILNTELGRCVTAELFGYACYRGDIESGRWNGRHQGSVGTADEAERWVNGDDTVAPLPIYPLMVTRG